MPNFTFGNPHFTAQIFPPLALQRQAVDYTPLLSEGRAGGPMDVRKDGWNSFFEEDCAISLGAFPASLFFLHEAFRRAADLSRRFSR